ncbi:NUDIX domain-containing protein [Chloroflexota bacterium]
MTEQPIMIGVGAVIEDNAGRVLLVKHIPERGGFWQGKWICPGGRLELGETIEEGIKREVREETQIEIDLLAPLPPFDTIVRSNDNVSLHVIYIDYLARVTGGKLKPGSDVGEAIWVEKKRIPEIWEELHQDTQRLLQIAKLVSLKRSGC